MDFSLSDEQRLLAEQVDRALAGLCPLARLHAQADAPDVFPDDLWQGLQALGLPGMLVPEAFGGLGLGLLDVALVAERLGRHAMPVPCLGPLVIAPLAIARAGSAAQQARLLPAIAAGTLRIAAALSEATAGARGEAGVACRHGRLSGRATFVVDALGAQRFLVADDAGGLHLADRDAAGLAIAALPTIDRTRSTALLTFDGVATEPLAAGAGDVLRRITDAARLVVAADALGAASRMLDQAVDYAKVREQFGRPIGAFQAVKHLCADMAAELEPWRALVWYAGYALDQDRADATLACLHAKAGLADAARFVARTATEVHGGIGITDALGLHFWFKRIAWDFQALGAPERLREEAARVQGLGAAS